MSRLLGALLVLLVPGAALGLDSVVIRSTTVIDVRSRTAREGATIVVEGDRIAEVVKGEPVRIPEGATVIDGRAKWVVPGFIDVHVHVASDRELTRALALGVTSVHLMPPTNEVELGWHQAARPAADPVPQIHLTPVLFTGGFPDNNHPGVYPVASPRGREEARREVGELASRGVRQIKIIQDDGRFWNGPSQLVPRLAPEVLSELVAEAHRRGLRVFVHATQVEDTRQAVRAGADAFMHGAMDAPLDEDLVSQMRERSVVWTPAMRVLLEIGDHRGHARRVLADRRLEGWLSEAEATALGADAAPGQTWPESPYQELMTHVAARMKQLAENTRKVRDGGVPIAVGSDLRWVGIGTHVEMELLSEAGLSPAEVLEAATYGGAVVLGVDAELGTIEPGKRADLVMLGADPLLDVRNAREVEWTMKAGRIFRSRDFLRESRGEGAAPQ
jgi:imidazolonepropionase-like amidohydrolase